jgi:retron-type reverse transcriptase
MKIQFSHKFEEIISLENLLAAWQEFLPGKRKKPDVQIFAAQMMDNILTLHADLVNFSYQPGAYKAFNISDPKPRSIHKANVHDRLLHHAIYRQLCPFFDKTFIFDSYSCRLEKGTHKAIRQFQAFFYKASANDIKTCWVLKGDIKKFFASIDQNILLNILKEKIVDKNVIWLLEKVVASFNSGQIGKGLPLGNLTSQLFANIYLDRFDQFVKHRLKIKYYIRYADDFVILADSREYLKNLITPISQFLCEKLKLEIHPKKIFIKTIFSGVDFLGWVNFPSHRVLRTATKRWMLKKLKENNYKKESVDSYLGLLSLGNTKKLQEYIKISPTLH